MRGLLYLHLCDLITSLIRWLTVRWCILQVEAPVDKVYQIWANRLNYSEWFDLIGQVRLPPALPGFDYSGL